MQVVASVAAQSPPHFAKIELAFAVAVISTEDPDAISFMQSVAQSTPFMLTVPAPVPLKSNVRNGDGSVLTFSTAAASTIPPEKTLPAVFVVFLADFISAFLTAAGLHDGD